MVAGWYEDMVSKKEAIKRRLLKALERDLHDNLRAGRVAAWGRVDRHSPLAPIAAEEWSDIKLSMEEVDFKNLSTGFCINFTVPAAYRKTVYQDVKFSKETVFKQYPLLPEPFGIDDGDQKIT